MMTLDEVTPYLGERCEIQVLDRDRGTGEVRIVVGTVERFDDSTITVTPPGPSGITMAPFPEGGKIAIADIDSIKLASDD